MKQYGAFKATEFTARQISAIYRKAKNGELNVEKWVINRFYELADYYNYDDNGSIAEEETKINEILASVFANDLITAQELINKYTKETFGLLSAKRQAKCDKSLVC